MMSKKSNEWALTCEFNSLLIGISLVLFIEITAILWRDTLSFSHLAPLLIVRSLEIISMMVLLKHFIFSKKKIGLGIKLGCQCSIIFAFIVVLSGFALFLISGNNPIIFFAFKLPDSFKEMLFFFLVGGLVGPVAEELFFRGLIYSYFRKFGVVFALSISTFSFAVCHYKEGSQLPIIQLLGGMVFCLIYEKSQNVVAPMTVHVLGNLGIFSINLFLIH